MSFLRKTNGDYVNSHLIITLSINSEHEIVAFDVRGNCHTLRELSTRNEAEARLQAILAGIDVR